MCVVSSVVIAVINVIASVLVKLGMVDKMDEICQSVLGDQHKIKQQKDPNKPKRAKSSYLYFCDDERPGVWSNLKKKLGKNEKLKIADVSKKLGSMWKKLDAKAKAKYEKLAEKKRAQCRTKLIKKQWEATGGNHSGAESWPAGTSRRQKQRDATGGNRSGPES